MTRPATPNSRKQTNRPPQPPSSKASGTRPPAPNQPRNPYAFNPDPEVVDPRWLLKALGLILLAAFACGYLTLCVLFYQGQWQLVLHPTRSTAAPSAIAGTPIQIIRFGVDESATPQLTGWWLPAAPGVGRAGASGAPTVLFLPSGDGSLADAATTLAQLHAVGLSVFAFDYRGYGQSAPTRPNQLRMQQDAAFAWQFLTTSRGLPAAQILPFGAGVGAALAVQLAVQHPQVPAVILQSPRPDILGSVMADPRTKRLPVRLLFHDRFEITAPLATLATPKLLILTQASGPANVPRPSVPPPDGTGALARAAAPPRMIVTLPAADFSNPIYREQLTRFLGQYVPQLISRPETPQLMPPPARPNKNLR